VIAWTDASVSAALALGTSAGAESSGYTAVSTDTRTLGAGSLFVALRGENHDAHDHLGAAAAAGARGAIVERVPDGAPEALRYHVVPDTLTALGQLARFHRRRLGIRVCAVTGSNGKTTTKELLRSVLGVRHRVYATPGNLNNLVGVPLTLLGCPAETEIVVAELGTNVPGEVARLAGIAEPDAAVITTVSAEHLEGLGDFDGVLREEASVLSWLPLHGAAVVSDEPAVLAEHARALHPGVRVAGFSDSADPEFHGSDLAVDDDGRVRFRWAKRDVALRLRGRHNGRNAAIALTLGQLWGIRPEAGVDAIATIEPQTMRTEIRHYGTLTIIADCYNANPGSVEAAIDLLSSMPRRGGRVAVLGTMRELGPSSAQVHGELARAVADAPLDLIVATGEFADAFAPLTSVLGERLIIEEDPMQAFDALAERLAGDELVLLKASRGVRMERLLPRFEEGWGMLHPHGEAFGSRASGTLTGASGQAPAEHTPPVTEEERGRDDGAQSEQG
jgi:UDP-N-acetylmuramoyl-tripeptide--D-alanyl-D-alanine ligase